MPKVFEESGFIGRFYMADLDEPVHIHVTKDGNVFMLPVLVPDIKSIRAFAQTLHTRGEDWSGMFEGWSAAYTPKDRTRQPANSKMTFVPAEFFVGESAIWHVAIAWEDGQDAPSVELENRRGIGGKGHVVYLDTPHGNVPGTPRSI